MKQTLKKIAHSSMALSLVLQSLAITAFPAHAFAISAPVAAIEAPAQEQLRRMTVDMTAYSSTPDQTDDSPFIAASGKHVFDGMIAANFLPFGTKVMIPELFGDKVFTVEDRMNRRFSERVDIWFPTRSAALRFGIQTAEIVIL